MGDEVLRHPGTTPRASVDLASGANPERTGHWRKRVLVCGGRYFDNLYAMRVVLDLLDGEQQIALIINGGATGADELARIWAKERGVPCETYPASWTVDGRAAGPKRNQRMIDKGAPDAVVAFPGGRGTADMVRRARRAGIPIIEALSGSAPDARSTDSSCKVPGSNNTPPQVERREP